MISLQLPLLVLNPDSCSIATFRRMLQLGAVADNLPSAHWAVRAIGQPPIGTKAPCPTASLCATPEIELESDESFTCTRTQAARKLNYSIADRLGRVLQLLTRSVAVLDLTVETHS